MNIHKIETNNLTADQQAIMNAAGMLANIAGIITGEGLTRTHNSASIMELPSLLMQLKTATHEYNRLICEEVCNRPQQYIISSE